VNPLTIPPVATSQSRRLLGTALLASLLTLSACSDDNSSAYPPWWGPSADLSEEITGSNPPFMGESSILDLSASGYIEREFVAAGTATSYMSPDDLTEDGRWEFEEDGSAPYRTRVIVRHPANASNFSGTVVVEWLNVSGGLDANPDFASLGEELLRQGHAWVGVSAQRIGIEGGPTIVDVPVPESPAGLGLKTIDPERYSSLAHPGDGFSFDIFTQVARALHEGGPALGYMRPAWLIASGDSQSAIALTTYYNGVQPLANVFDGFFIHSRAAFALPLVGPGEFADIAGGFGGVPVIFRTDLDVPVLDVQAENDVVGVLGSVSVRQPDSETFRLWEVAGTAHADATTLGFTADFVDCGVEINDAPFHVVAKAAFRELNDWVAQGELALQAPRLDVTLGLLPILNKNADGIALGGIRTPPLDVPVDVLSGTAGPSLSLICLLLGSTTPLPPARISELYVSPDDYLQQYEAATDAAIEAGFVLEEDRAALLEFAKPERVPE
jgi:Alpha/beta hydrolase domain